MEKPKNPMEVDLIVQHVLKYLPSHLLPVCRLVNKNTWLHCATLETRKRGRILTFNYHTPSDHNGVSLISHDENQPHVERILRFVNFFEAWHTFPNRNWPWPFPRIYLDGRIFMADSRTIARRNRPLFDKFWKLIAAELTDIEVGLWLCNGPKAIHIPESVRFPQVKRVDAVIEFESKSFKNYPDNQLHLLNNILANVDKLESLMFTGEQGIFLEGLLDRTNLSFLKTLNLSIEKHVSDAFCYLTKQGVRLNSLILEMTDNDTDLTRESLRQFLKNQSGTLKNLTLNLPELPPDDKPLLLESLEFPVLENLELYKMATVEWHRGFVVFKKQFPKLKRLHLANQYYRPCYFRYYCDAAESLEELAIPALFAKSFQQDVIQHAPRLFPSIRKLVVCGLLRNLPQMLANFEKVAELTICTCRGPVQLDDVLSGFVSLKKTDISKYCLGIKRNRNHFAHKLQVIRVRGLNSVTMSDLSWTLVLCNMRKLQILDMSGANEVYFNISQPVLEKMREKFLVLLP